MQKNIQKVLIANRGEIACRIIRTLDQMGIESVAVFSDADRNALHVQSATHSVYIGPSPATESYLRVERIIEAAVQSGADAIHPGYGFLSENPLLAEACEQNNIVFIGPPPQAIRAMGSKSAAKRIMEKSGVPLIPGYHGDDQQDDILKAAADSIGYPVILKAALGGGGKGMRIVHAAHEFKDALASCRREAQSSFNDSTILVEKYIGQPRHVEMQVFCDQHGNAVHLFDRDCSIQRRHQKIIEEAPAPGIPDSIRSRMAQDAILAAKAIDYVGAGTVEFLFDGVAQYYFMEMNTRLQVEHPVTEMITGVDLVQWQVDVASGKPLSLSQDQIATTGHSIEVRLCAEDCNQNFIPSTGNVSVIRTPATGQSVRIDTGIKSQDVISVYYDPMFGKLITWGRNRQEAISKILLALQETCITGIETNIEYLHGIIQSDAFQAEELSTHFLASHERVAISDDKKAASAIAACLYRVDSYTHNSNTGYGWRLNAGTYDVFDVSIGDTDYSIRINQNGRQWDITCNDATYFLSAQIHNNSISLQGSLSGKWIVHQDAEQTWLFNGATRYRVKDSGVKHGLDESDADQKYTSPMPGVVTQVFVKESDAVKKGDALVSIEAMKMEHVIYAKQDGVIEAVFFKSGDSVMASDKIVRMQQV